MASRYIKESSDRLNELYAAGINYGGYEAMVQATEREHTAIWDGAKIGLGKNFSEFEKAIADAAAADPNGTATYRTVFDSYADLKYKGWKSPSEAKKVATDAFNAGRGQAERTAGSAKSTDSGVRGNSNSFQPKTLREAEEMVSGLHASGRTISVAEFRELKARFGKS